MQPNERLKKRISWSLTPVNIIFSLWLFPTGNYEAQIIAALRAWGATPTEWNIRNVLFDCVGGPNGDIKVLSPCFTTICIDAGENKNDYCT